jgi:hypothetical protein
VADEPKSVLPEAPRLPQRAAIYIAPDGGVKFGALFEDLVPVAAAIAATPLCVERPRDLPGIAPACDPGLEP